MSYIEIETKRFQCHCQLCQHDWTADKLPKRCASCKSPAWNTGNKTLGRIAQRFPAHGKNLTITEWAKETGLPRQRIYYRLVNGMTIEQALSPDVLPKGHLAKAAK